MAPEFGVHITYRRSDGTVVSRSQEVRFSPYDRAPMSTFRKKARAATIASLNAVLGTPVNVKVDRDA